MPSRKDEGGLLRFGPFEVRVEAGEILRDGQRVRIQLQPFKLLLCLLEQPGRILSREELYDRLWPTGTFVDFEHGLNTVVRKLRRALRDGPDAPLYVETMPNRGYRFAARVDAVRSDGKEPIDTTLEATRRTRAAMLARPPFVGREAELARLERRLDDAAEGLGGVALVAGEPGIGKTRLLEELGANARRGGHAVLAGRCTQGEVAVPYAPFADAVAGWVREADPVALRAVADAEHWSVVAKLVPLVRTKLTELPEPPPLRPDEERLRLLDAATQLTLGMAKRCCLLLSLDDLQWAEPATLALLASLARRVGGARVLIVGAFRDVEVDAAHPLAHTIDVLAREGRFESVALEGLAAQPIHAWIGLVSDGRADAEFADTVCRATNGNPLFVRELVLEWSRDWRPESCTCPAVNGIGVPPSVRAMIERRLARLSPDARRLLGCASAFSAAFFFEAAANAAGLDENEALDALDEAHQAQLVRPCGGPDDYEFVHALIRSALYESMQREQRDDVHRRIAEAMEREQAGGGPVHAAEIAEHYHASRSLPGAAAGVRHALVAAERAEAVADFDAAARCWRMALDLAARDDVRRARLLGRLALALAWSGNTLDAEKAANEAADAIEANEGADATADFLADAADAVWMRSWDPSAWSLASRGFRCAGERRDWVWVRLGLHEIMASDAFDPEFPGLARDTELRRDVFRALLANRHRLSAFELNETWHCAIFDSRDDVLERAGDIPASLVFCAGEYRAGLDLYRRQVESGEASRGAMAGAISFHASKAMAEAALGLLDDAEASSERARSLEDRIDPASWVHLASATSRGVIAAMRGVDTTAAADELDRHAGPVAFPVFVMKPPFKAFAGHLHALAGDFARGLDGADVLLRAAERYAGWSPSYVFLVTSLAAAHWLCGATGRGVARLERCIRERVLAADFRFPNVDARLALAQLCALNRRWDEAAHWFARARKVLDEQGAHPLRAITDYDEALMYARRDARGDAARVRDRLDDAVSRFEAIGMTGWIPRADQLRRSAAPEAPRARRSS